MDGLIAFEDSVQRIEEQKAVTALLPDPSVIAIRERLLSPNYADALEIRTALLADLMFRAYIHLLNIQRDRINEDRQA